MSAACSLLALRNLQYIFLDHHMHTLCPPQKRCQAMVAKQLNFDPCHVCINYRIRHQEPDTVKPHECLDGGAVYSVVDNSLRSEQIMEAAQHHLLDLSYLTEEERERLVAVIKADEELRIRDRIRLG